MVSCDTRLYSSSGCVLFSQPAICSGDQSNLSFPATDRRSRQLIANLQLFGRRDRAHAFFTLGTALMVSIIASVRNVSCSWLFFARDAGKIHVRRLPRYTSRSRMPDSAGRIEQ